MTNDLTTNIKTLNEFWDAVKNRRVAIYFAVPSVHDQRDPGQLKIGTVVETRNDEMLLRSDDGLEWYNLRYVQSIVPVKSDWIK